MDRADINMSAVSRYLDGLAITSVLLDTPRQGHVAYF